MKKLVVSCICVLAGLWASADGGEREQVWPKGLMPHRQAHQIAAMQIDTKAKGFDRAAHTEPYLEWCEKPANPNGICLVMISGGGYSTLCCHELIARWTREYTAFGCQCVKLVYRSPRPQGLPIYQSAWEDGQRAVRLVRAAAAKRGYDPKRIGAIGMSAGGHLAALLATRSLTSAYEPVDELDRTVPCNVDFAIVCALPYAMTDGLTTENVRGGDRCYATFTDLFTPDAKTPPMCFFHGCHDTCSPLATTELYRRLRQRKVPAELHLYADREHCGIYAENCFEEAAGFLRQLNLDGRLGMTVPLDSRFPDAPDTVEGAWTKIWPADKMPDVTTNQCAPEIKWFVPKNLKTKAIQIIYSGGAYCGNNPDSSWDGTRAARRFLNAKGMAVVVFRYRVPRPFGLPKHVSAWQDLQRAVRVVRSEAAKRGLDGDRIGILGGSAGGHLTLMGATTSLSRSYLPVDAVDKLSCSVQWGIACYPAYVLTDGEDGCNRNGGNGDGDRVVDEFAFDRATPPMLFLHGDADGYAAMGSVKCWERLRRIGAESTLHTYVTRGHCFMNDCAPVTGSYNWLNRIWDFLEQKSIVSRTPPEAAADGLRRTLDSYVDGGRVAGVVSVLSDADYNERYDCAGWADMGGKGGAARRMAPDTVFAIFSMSKTFLGAAMMCAIDEGKISLDDPVSKYLPEFADVKMKDGSKPKRPLTVRDMTSHVNGFRGGYELVNRDLPMREVARRLAATPLHTQPGETFSYGTATIDTAGACLEVAVGKPFEVYLKEKILDPLGMKDTTFTPNADQVKRLVKAYTTDDKALRPAADGCVPQIVFPKAKPLCAAPGGGLFSTPRDMVRFSQMLAHHGEWKGKRIISRSTFDQIFAVKQTPASVPNPYTCGSWIYGDWFGHEGAMRTDQRANLRTGQSRVFFIETENRAGSAFFQLKKDWHAACDRIQGTPPTVFGN